MSRLEAFLLAGGLFNLVAVVEFVRRRKLQEGFALLWVLVSALGLVAVLARSQLDRLARAVGVAYGATLFLALGIVFLLFVCMSLSLHVSRLHRQVEVLAEEIAFLRGVAEPDATAERPGPAFSAPAERPGAAAGDPAR
ncbi:MAG: DUF2304 domain-containing protein [Acidimicrobiia bacterium]